MRACNGCRKRKIKCDAATTNTWPCSACTRLKLVCVPPTIGQDGEFINEGIDSTQEANVSSAASETSQHSFPVPPSYNHHTSQPSLGSMTSYDGMNMYSSYVPPPSSHSGGLYNEMRQSPMVMPHQSYSQQPQVYSAPPPQTHVTTPERAVYSDNDQSTADNLSEVLGELKIDETGIGTLGRLSFSFSPLHSLSLAFPFSCLIPLGRCWFSTISLDG